MVVIFLKEVLPNDNIDYEDIKDFNHGNITSSFKATFKENNSVHSDTGWYGCMNLSDQNQTFFMLATDPREQIPQPNWQYLFVKCKTKL